MICNSIVHLLHVPVSGHLKKNNVLAAFQYQVGELLSALPCMCWHNGAEMLQASRTQHGNSNLALWLRLYIYGLHGFFTEILFTAGWEFIVSGNWKLPGYTSVWSLAIYGISGTVMENIYAACKRLRIPLLLRGVCYLLWVYTWEFSTGLLLKQFNACPWDYSEFNYNVRGLITFEYAPLWFLVSILMERVVIAHVSELRWATSSPHNGLAARLKD